MFLAAIWFSTYKTLSGPKLAAIVVDLSEDLRDREDLSLNHLLKNTRILIGAMSHEIRNLCGAVSAVGRNLARVEGLSGNQDFEALQTLIQGLEKIASLELQASPEDQGIAVDVMEVLDELRVLIEPSFREAEMAVRWQIAAGLPLGVGGFLRAAAGVSESGAEQPAGHRESPAQGVDHCRRRGAGFGGDPVRR